MGEECGGAVRVRARSCFNYFSVSEETWQTSVFQDGQKLTTGI